MEDHGRCRQLENDIQALEDDLQEKREALQAAELRERRSREAYTRLRTEILAFNPAEPSHELRDWKELVSELERDFELSGSPILPDDVRTQDGQTAASDTAGELAKQQEERSLADLDS